MSGARAPDASRREFLRIAVAAAFAGAACGPGENPVADPERVAALRLSWHGATRELAALGRRCSLEVGDVALMSEMQALLAACRDEAAALARVQQWIADDAAALELRDVGGWQLARREALLYALVAGRV